MAHGSFYVDTAHKEPIHAAQLDHFGKRLATASADSTVSIWEVETRDFVAELTGHEGPVWAVTWAHPKFGPVVATAGLDKQVIVWREAEGGWLEVHRWDAGSAVLAAAFGPWEYDMQLAVACADGRVHVLRRRADGEGPDGDVGGSPAASAAKQQRWAVESFSAHQNGALAVCWAPATSPAKLGVERDAAARSSMLMPRRLVTGGGDAQVRLWRHDDFTDSWADQHHFPPHRNSVRDVAWRPNVGIPSNTIASCSDDGTVVIWTQVCSGQPWMRQMRCQLEASAWQLSWSVTGSILAVATSDNAVQLYSEALDGQWTASETAGDQEPPLQSSPIVASAA